MFRLFLLFLLSFLMLFGSDPQFPDCELNIQLENVPTDFTITFELKPIGQNWSQDTNHNFLVTNDNSTQTSSLIVDDTHDGSIDCWFNGFEYRFSSQGNYTTVTDCAQSTAGLKALRNGFYKMSVKVIGELKTFVYFDWRDTGFTNSCGNNDMTIRYDYDLEKLKFWNDNSIRVGQQQPDLILQAGQIITWSDYNCSTRNFTRFWSEGLVLISKKNPISNFQEPMLVWGPYGGFQPDGYKIYFRRGTSGSFNLIGTVDAGTYSFIHSSHTFGGTEAEYKVQAYNSSSSSPFTNTVNTNVMGYSYKNSNQHEKSIVNSYTIFDSYPNPFNPSTTLKYKLSDEQFVSIRIYDIIGRLVKTVLYNKQSKGTYSITWHGDSDDGSKLGSGIYFFMINIGTSNESKKVILIK